MGARDFLPVSTSRIRYPIHARSGAKNLNNRQASPVHGTTIITLQAGERLVLRNRSAARLRLDPITGSDVIPYTVSFTAYKL